MFKKFIKFIKSIFSIEESSTFKENIKPDYHFQINTNPDTDNYMAMNLVEGPIPEKGEAGTLYLANKYTGIKLWDGERYLPVVSINEHSDPLILYVTELPLFGKPDTVYVLTGDGYRENYLWNSSLGTYQSLESLTNDFQEPVYS